MAEARGMAPRILFWPHKPAAQVASTRIRALQVVAGLQRLGLAAEVCEVLPAQAAPELLVLAKRYDAASLEAAKALRQRHGTRLVLDLCDNHFYDRRHHAEGRERAERLVAACRSVDRVVVSTPPLAEAVRAACGPSVALKVVPDGLDGGDPSATSRWTDALHRLRLRAFLARHRVPPGRRLLWFGQHGVPHAEAGLRDLTRVAPALARHHARKPLQLIVLSNRWLRYREVSAAWTWPSLYLPWSPALFEASAAASDIALIPAQSNPFTVCKTNNRPASAFMRGLAVAADALPSYRSLAPWAVLNDWDEGLGRLMEDAGGRAERVAAARVHLAEHHHPERIARTWAATIAELLPASALPPP